MDEALKALADGTRRRILALVSQQERTAGDIARHFTVSRPAISQHLKVLLDAGLVSVRGDGTRRYYHADALGLDALRREMEQLWLGRLNLLKQVAEAEARAAERSAEHAADRPASVRDRNPAAKQKPKGVT